MAGLTEEDVKNISISNKSKGCMLLADKLGLLPYDKDLNMKTDIYIDYLYDHLLFAVEKGFPWKSVLFVVKFADNLLSYSKGQTLSQSVIWYRQNAEELVANLDETFFKMYTDFVFTSFMSHYQLLQYVFTRERETCIPHVELEVTPPISPLSFKIAKEKDIFNYEKKYADLEQEGSEREIEILLEKEKLHEVREDKTQELMDTIVTKEESFTKEKLSDMIKTILESLTSSFTEDIKLDILKTQESLKCKINKTSLPRPQVLGPPPRYKPNTPVSSRGRGRKSPDSKPKSPSRAASRSK